MEKSDVLADADGFDGDEFLLVGGNFSVFVGDSCFDGDAAAVVSFFDDVVAAVLDCIWFNVALGIHAV